MHSSIHCLWCVCMCVCVSKSNKWKKQSQNDLSVQSCVSCRLSVHCQELLDRRWVCSLWQHTSWWKCFPVGMFPLANTLPRSFCVSLVAIFSAVQCVGTTVGLIQQNHQKSTGMFYWKQYHHLMLQLFGDALKCEYIFPLLPDRGLIFWVNRRVPVWAIQVRVPTLQRKCS